MHHRLRALPCQPSPVLIPCCVLLFIHSCRGGEAHKGPVVAALAHSHCWRHGDQQLWASSPKWSTSSPNVSFWELHCWALRALRGLCAHTLVRLGQFLLILTRAAKDWCYKQHTLLFQSKSKKFTVEHVHEFNMPNFILNIILRNRWKILEEMEWERKTHV